MRIRDVGGPIISAAATAALLGAVAGLWGGRLFWVFEIFSHFRMQNACVLVACGVGLFAAGRYRRAGVSLLVAVGLFATAVPFYLSNTEVRTSPGIENIRLLIANVYHGNRQPDRLKAVLHEEQPDLAVLLEVEDSWAEIIRSLDDEYPWQVIVPTPVFGVAVISRVPFEHLGDACDRTDTTASPVVRFTAGENAVTLVAAHPVPPAGDQNADRRNVQLECYSDYIVRQPGPVILAGDLNCTAWSPFFRDLVEKTGLRDSRTGFGLQPSWPVGNPILQIAIDHCLVSPELTVVNRRTGTDIGSDHRPVICDLAVRRQR